MYIRALAGGIPLTPMPPAGGHTTAIGRGKERDVAAHRQCQLRQGLPCHAAVITGERDAIG